MNLEVVEAWFRGGGHIHDGFPDQMKENPEFGLLIAQHCGHWGDDFRLGVSNQLKSDKVFMMAAIEKNSYLYFETSAALNGDFDLAVAAFASPTASDLKQCLYDTDDTENLRFLSSVREKVQNKLKAHELFSKGFLYGISEHAGPSCPVRLLLQDDVTTLAYKKLIAEFLGVPTGKELGQFRRASKTLPMRRQYLCLWKGDSAVERRERHSEIQADPQVEVRRGP